MVTGRSRTGRATGPGLPPFEAAVTEHGAAVLAVCRAVLGHHDAEEAWSETFLAALRAYPRLRPDSDVRAWLVTIAHRKAVDVYRAQRRAPVAVGALADRPGADEPGPETPDAALAEALAALPFKQRAAVAYRYLADLAYPDIAALLQSNEAAARRSVSTGLATLRRTYPGGVLEGREEGSG